MFDLIRGGPLEILLSQVANKIHKASTAERRAEQRSRLTMFNLIGGGPLEI